MKEIYDHPLFKRFNTKITRSATEGEELQKKALAFFKQIMMEKLDVSATSRASFYIYNTKEEINIFINALDEAIKLFRL